MSWNIFCDNTFGDGNTLRSDCFGGPGPGFYDVGVITGNCSAILGGQPLAAPINFNNGDLSTIVNGQYNCINIFSGTVHGERNTIVNGYCNVIGGTAAGSFPAFGSTIIGGCRHCIDTNTTAYTLHALIGAGGCNLIGAESNFSFIGAGCCNEIDVSSTCSFIGGGAGNYISGSGSFIGGGGCVDPLSPPGPNQIYSNFGVIGGGTCNVINIFSDCSFIGGGNINNVGALAGGGLGSIYSAIGGGYNNCIDDTSFESQYSSIFGGSNHCVNGNYIFIGGGDANCICSTAGSVIGSAIAGGGLNAITDNGIAPASGSFIGGGAENNIFGITSSIVGGVNHCIFSASSFVGGGDTNVINLASDCSFISGGSINNIGAVAGSGLGSIFSAIGGGYNNCIDDTNFASQCSSIFGGSNNFGNGNGLFIGGGDANCIFSPSIIGPVSFSTIGGGASNRITDNGVITADISFIGGGTSNKIFDCGSVIVGGQNNNVCSQFSFIGGGDTNSIDIKSSCSFIGSGYYNYICGCGSAIITGGRERVGFPPTGNYIYDDFSGVFTGYGNKVHSCFSAIFTGFENCIGATGCQNGIFVGRENTINNNSCHAFIGTGCLNSIGAIGGAGAGNDFNIIVGGCLNNIDDTGATTCYGVIGGGYQNFIGAGTNHASIFSGYNNQVSGSCSSILGGENNNDNGNPYTGIFGTGVNGLPLAAGNGGFFVNEMVIQNIPVITAATFFTLLPGEVYTTGPVGSPFMGRPLFIA